MYSHLTSEDKIKPFRLVKYFAFTSLIVMLIMTFLLTAINTHWAKTIQQKEKENYALLLIENLNHQIFMQFLIPVMLKYGKVQLRNKEQFDRMDEVVRNTLHSFKIETVNIYDMNNIISYSFDKELVGKKNAGGAGYQRAILCKSTSTLVQSGNFWEILFAFPKESKVVTLAPLYVEKPVSRISGHVLGVVEVVQDVSDDYKKIFKFHTLVVVTCSSVMGLLFLILLLVVKRGEGIIQRRAMEGIRLKEELNRAEHLASLGEMVAGVSHELRNPLGIIRSCAELLKKKMFRLDPSNTFPDIIVEESSRLNNIITDFLDFAKPRNPNLRACSAEKVIEKNFAFLAPRIKERNYVIHKHYQDNIPEIMGDSDMLYQAFLNILINASQSMPGTGQITVEIVSNGNMVTILFEDEGGGISGNIMDKIWEPFFTTKEKGTGLGLGIVKSIIELHKGTIAIENRIDCGVRVTVKLPIKS